MAVADIFTAITEDRPYRKGMSREDAITTLDGMVRDNAICPYVESLLVDNMEEIDEMRKNAQIRSAIKYNYIMAQ